MPDEHCSNCGGPTGAVAPSSETPRQQRKSPSKIRRDRDRICRYNRKKSGKKEPIRFVSGGIVGPTTTATITYGDGEVLELTPKPVALPEDSPGDRGRREPPPLNYEDLCMRNRLRDRIIFRMVRSYLGYFQHTTNGEMVNGESKVTAVAMIRSEGLPLGDKLREVYAAHLTGFGLSEEEILTDLKKTAEDMRQTRRLRVETIWERDKRMVHS